MSRYGKNNGPIKYTIVDNFDHIVDERGNQTINLRKLYWGDDESKVRLDLRRWTIGEDGQEMVGKGVSFMTEEGPHTLVDTMVQEGYGHTTDILKGLSVREDFKPSLNRVLGEDEQIYVGEEASERETFYDPRSSLF